MRESIGCIITILAFIGIVILYFLGVGLIETIFNEIMTFLAKLPFWLFIVAGIVFMVILVRRDRG